jgi:hypothetical protein
MAIRLFPTPTQFQALSYIRDLDSQKIQTIIDGLENITPPLLRPSELRETMVGLLPDDADRMNVIAPELISLYTLKRGRGLTTEQLVEGLRFAISSERSEWSPEDISKWQEMEPRLRHLLSLGSVATIVKALDLSFDYYSLLQNSKIITDIRPVFNEAGSEILGALVSFTLRLHLDSISGSSSMSIALDQADVKKLLEACERALKKAKTAQAFMRTGGINQTFISGEEE